MAEQKLNLFEFASTSMAEARAAATKIVRCQILDAGPHGTPFDRIPNYVGCHATILSRSILQNPPEHFPNSAFHMLRAVIPHMRKSGAGRIIAVGTRAAENPGPSVGAYSASKAALVSLMRTAALENKDLGITANVILPGTMDTADNRKAMPGADTSQWVQPASVASLIVWLAGDAGKDVTGAAIPVYGRGL